MEGLHDHLPRFRDSFLSSDHSHMSVNDMWVSFKSEVLEKFIPTKMTKTKYSLPWIDHLNIFPIPSPLKLMTMIPIAREKNEKCKRFWSFVKSLKKDTLGITSLRENGILKTDTVNKANICNKQFQSASTHETDSEIPSKGTSPFTPMGDITVDPKGVLKLLNGLKVHKAPGPDGLSARVLKECSSEITPILAFIYNESLAQGTVPDDWRQANVAPVYIVQ